VFTVGALKPATFILRIRKPAWATQGVSITINGRPFRNIDPGADGYIAIDRKWSNNDKVTIHLPESFYTESMPDNADRIALFYGPVLLAGLFGNTEPDPLKGVPVLVTGEKDPNKWIKKEGLVFRTANVGQPGDIALIPFNRTKNEYYSVYWDRFTPESWAARQDQYREERRQRQELEDRTIDRLRLGEMQPERLYGKANRRIRGTD